MRLNRKEKEQVKKSIEEMLESKNLDCILCASNNQMCFSGTEQEFKTLVSCILNVCKEEKHNIPRKEMHEIVDEIYDGKYDSLTDESKKEIDEKIESILNDSDIDSMPKELKESLIQAIKELKRDIRGE